MEYFWLVQEQDIPKDDENYVFRQCNKQQKYFINCTDFTLYKQSLLSS